MKPVPMSLFDINDDGVHLVVDVIRSGRRPRLTYDA